MKKHITTLFVIVVSLVAPLRAQPWETLPSDSYFATYKPLKAPATETLLLQPGDRLAICGDSSIRSGMTLVPFNHDLNRFLLIVRTAPAGRYRVTWGETSRTYTSEELAQGINLAADFETNPFSEAFQRVDEAVAKKQAYETRQIKDLFHGPEGKADMDMTATLTEKARTPLADAIRAAFVPIRHAIVIAPER